MKPQVPVKPGTTNGTILLKRQAQPNLRREILGSAFFWELRLRLSRQT